MPESTSKLHFVTLVEPLVTFTSCFSSTADQSQTLGTSTMLKVADVRCLAIMCITLIHDLLFLPISTIESAVGKRLITHCSVSLLACSRLSGHIQLHSPQLQA